jgi:esterase/lipase
MACLPAADSLLLLEALFMQISGVSSALTWPRRLCLLRAPLCMIQMILDMVNQNVQKTLKKFQDNKNREFKKAKEEIKETIEALYKHQSETKNTINR